jgi:hypothetical protein
MCLKKYRTVVEVMFMKCRATKLKLIPVAKRVEFCVETDHKDNFIF